MNLLSTFFIGLLMLLTFDYFGSKSLGLGYTGYKDIIRINGSLGFNFLFRILTPTVFISIISIILYLSNLGDFVNNIYLSVIWYILLKAFLITLLMRWDFVNLYSYFITQAITILIAYFVYWSALSKGLSYILPEAGNFRTELWFIIILYFYNVAENYHPENSYYTKRSNTIKKRFKKYKEKYSNLLKDEIQNNRILLNIFFSIMIIEDLNRSEPVRILERFLFPLNVVKTSGIMQVESGKCLSDNESIKRSQEIFIKVRKEFKELNSLDQVNEFIKKICAEYNPGDSYFETVKSIYYDIYE